MKKEEKEGKKDFRAREKEKEKVTAQPKKEIMVYKNQASAYRNLLQTLLPPIKRFKIILIRILLDNPPELRHLLL